MHACARIHSHSVGTQLRASEKSVRAREDALRAQEADLKSRQEDVQAREVAAADKERKVSCTADCS
jgi:hypothetical protein